MKYLVEYYYVENGEDSIDFFTLFSSLDEAIDFVRGLLIHSNSSKYYVISEIAIVKDDMTDYFRK